MADVIEIPSAAPAVDQGFKIDPTVNIGETQEGGLSVSREGIPTPPAAETTGRPEKFKSDEDGWKAYRELEQKISGKPDDPAAPAKPATPPVTPPPVTGPDFTSYETELKADGKLSEKSYKELTDKGYPQDLVDRYIAGQNAMSDNLTNELVNAAGGAEPLKAMQEWAEANYTDAELTAYNASLDGDQATKKLAINGLKAAYENAKGTDTNLLSGNKTTESVESFRDQAEVTAAMNDPRYTRSEAYRDDVMNKLKHSDFMIANKR